MNTYGFTPSIRHPLKLRTHASVQRDTIHYNEPTLCGIKFIPPIWYGTGDVQKNIDRRGG